MLIVDSGIKRSWSNYLFQATWMEETTISNHHLSSNKIGTTGTTKNWGQISTVWRLQLSIYFLQHLRSFLHPGYTKNFKKTVAFFCIAIYSKKSVSWLFAAILHERNMFATQTWLDDCRFPPNCWAAPQFVTTVMTVPQKTWPVRQQRRHEFVLLIVRFTPWSRNLRKNSWTYAKWQDKWW